MIKNYYEKKFHNLNNYQNWILKGLEVEWEMIENRVKNGEIQKLEDYEAAINYPLLIEEIAAHSILHLLNVIVEEQLRIIVENSTEYLFDPNNPVLLTEKIANHTFKEIIDHIEKKYEIHLADFHGWKHYRQLRKNVNTLKHRSGERRLKEVLKEGGSWEDLHYKPNFLDANKSIDTCLSFVKTLYKIVQT